MSMWNGLKLCKNALEIRDFSERMKRPKRAITIDQQLYKNMKSQRTQFQALYCNTTDKAKRDFIKSIVTDLSIGIEKYDKKRRSNRCLMKK